VSERAVFRIPPLTILGAVLLAVCATPVAFGAPWFWLVYLLPVARQSERAPAALRPWVVTRERRAGITRLPG
jgi:hypothetical protein